MYTTAVWTVGCLIESEIVYRYKKCSFNFASFSSGIALTLTFIYEWALGGSGAKVSQALLLSPSVLRLHVANIDFCPLLQKYTTNQYSNKSSFRLEKCSFQASGHKVWVLSGLQFDLGLHLPNNWDMSKQCQCDTHCTVKIFTVSLSRDIAIVWFFLMSFFCQSSIPS